MKSYLRRIVAELGHIDVLTYTLPYQTRFDRDPAQRN